MADNYQRQSTGGGGGGQNQKFADYVPVAERVEKFHARFPEGRILTAIVEHDREAGFVLMRAEVYRTNDDTTPAATGHAYEVRGDGYVNKSSYVENCETGACGRALAMLGFEVKRGIASREEMQKSERMSATASGSSGGGNTGGGGSGNVTEINAHLASAGQVTMIRQHAGRAGVDADEECQTLTGYALAELPRTEVNRIIKHLQAAREQHSQAAAS